MTHILGLSREPACSPGRHLENDAAILELVASELEARGHRVALATASAAQHRRHDAELVFSMSRSPEGLELLAQWARQGKIVVNHPDAVLAATRDRLAAAVVGMLALPAAHVVPTARVLRDRIDTVRGGDWWIKGGGLHASRREDVQRAGNADLDRVLDDFERRGISTAVLQEHVTGREIKFYAVGTNGFFYCLDTVTGIEIATPPPELHAAAVGAGLARGLEIFGGDIVVGDDGGGTLIDLNDWPSFAPCRDTAAASIARYLEARLAAGYAIASPAGSVAPSPA
jgi:hypothetical protein